MINKRNVDSSCNKEKFDKIKSVYETALKDSGHFSSMPFNNSITQNTRRNRSRQVTWFNPAYSQNMETNTVEPFMKLVRWYFLKNNKYRKVFN